MFSSIARETGRILVSLKKNLNETKLRIEENENRKKTTYLY